jgi:outer membrane protein TolC
MTSRDSRIAVQPFQTDDQDLRNRTVPLDIKPGLEQSVNAPEKKPLNITVSDAIFMALENNRSLLVERINPSIQETFEDEERAVFDPILNATGSVLQNDSRLLNSSGRYEDHSASSVFQGSVSLKEFFPSGTFVEVGTVTKKTNSDQYNEPYATTRLGLTVTQSLLQGKGTHVNTARLRQSRLETDITRYELRGFSESLLAQVEYTYWDYALSLRQMEIVEESLKLARQQISETEEMIKVGKMAEAELAALEAEAAAQQQGLIDAGSTLESNRLRLIRLINPPGNNPWEREITLVHPPTLPEIRYDDIGVHVALSMKMRPEINQAKLDIQKNDIEIVRTRNGLLPRMDLFITLGKSGYADSFSGSVGDIKEESYDMMMGLNFEYPIFNRKGSAQQRRAVLNRDKAKAALDNLEQIIELDVRSAYIDLHRTKEQISASTATRKFQEENLRTETEKFRVGRSTNLLVAQVQRDLLQSRINEVSSIVNYLKAIVYFYRMEGTLLEHRNITASDLNSSGEHKISGVPTPASEQ